MLFATTMEIKASATVGALLLVFAIEAFIAYKISVSVMDNLGRNISDIIVDNVDLMGPMDMDDERANATGHLFVDVRRVEIKDHHGDISLAVSVDSGEQQFLWSNSTDFVRSTFKRIPLTRTITVAAVDLKDLETLCYVEFTVNGLADNGYLNHDHNFVVNSDCVVRMCVRWLIGGQFLE